MYNLPTNLSLKLNFLKGLWRFYGNKKNREKYK